MDGTYSGTLATMLYHVGLKIKVMAKSGEIMSIIWKPLKGKYWVIIGTL